MRILQISKYYYPYTGGIETTCKQLVELMPQYETAVLCFNEGKDDIVDVVNEHKVYRAGTFLTIARQAIAPTYRKMFKKAIHEFNPDILHIHWANPFMAAMIVSVIPKSVKVVLHWHMDIVNQKRIYPFVRPFETALLKRADMILATSQLYAESSNALKPFINKVKVLPSAIEEEKLILKAEDKSVIMNIKNTYGNKPIVFFVGRHIQYKGLLYLIEAANFVKSDCVIVIAGNGPLTEKLKAQCKSDKIHFVGRLSDDLLRQYHYASHVTAFPSITKNEAFGLTLVEGMYCGVPAVTFTIEGSGVNWVSKNNETCLEVENGNAKAYADAIDRLITDEALWQRLSEAGKQRARDLFTVSKMCERMDKLYISMMRNKLTNINSGGVIWNGYELQVISYEIGRSALHASHFSLNEEGRAA